jgi:hypothetical protein
MRKRLSLGANFVENALLRSGVGANRLEIRVQLYMMLNSVLA